MIDRANAVADVRARLRKLAPGRGIVLLTYKRDRSLTIVRLDRDGYEIREDGFEKRTHRTDGDGLKRLLKTLLKREFPRSNKIRVQAWEDGMDLPD